MTETIKAWHFVADTLRDGRPVPPDGTWLRHDGPVKICATPGPWRVEAQGHAEQGVARHNQTEQEE